jgi:hypothetical protein
VIGAAGICASAVDRCASDATSAAFSSAISLSTYRRKAHDLFTCSAMRLQASVTHGAVFPSAIPTSARGANPAWSAMYAAVIMAVDLAPAVGRPEKFTIASRRW